MLRDEEEEEADEGVDGAAVGPDGHAAVCSAEDVRSVCFQTELVTFPLLPPLHGPSLSRNETKYL